MSHFIEEFYYGNIEPQESITELKAEIKKKLDALSQTEEQLTSKLTEEENDLFLKYASQSGEFLRGIMDKIPLIADLRGQICCLTRQMPRIVTVLITN